LKPLATQLPWMVLPGNHERDWPDSGSLFSGDDSGGECGVPYNRRFPMPASFAALAPSAKTSSTRALQTRMAKRLSTVLRAGHGLTPFSTQIDVNMVPNKQGVVADTPWYSYVYGPVYFVALSTEHDFSTGSAQYNWLVSTLAAVNRQVYPWLVVAGHRPMYIDSTNYTPPNGDQPVAVLLRQYVEPLFRQYSVDFAMWGHHHSYQRTCPVFNQTCVSQGTVHTVIGMAGAGLSTNLQAPTPSWIVKADATFYGYASITASPSTFTFRSYKNGVPSELFDEFTLTK
jgi:acid phosphatase type 7